MFSRELWKARVSLRTLSLLGLFLFGCENDFLVSYDCVGYPDQPECQDPCPGQCIPIAPLEFNGPALLWIGREADAPRCPDRAPKRVYEGHADLDASNQCVPCACADPVCVLPSGVTASSSPMCQGPGFIPLDTPAGWDGSCTSPATVGPNELGSVTLEPPTLSPCTPIVDHVTAGDLGVPSPWGTFARACSGEPIPNVCGDPGLTCMPSAEPPPRGFQQCILFLRDGEPQCPADYPEKHLFFGGLEDTRACTACQCTPAGPSSCAALTSVYADDSCATLLASVLMTDAPVCTGVAGGMGLGSLEAAWVTDEPGTCIASGGVAVGEAKPVAPTYFCCQPAPGSGHP